MCITQTLMLCWAAQKYKSHTRAIILGSGVEPFFLMSLLPDCHNKKNFCLVQWDPHVWTATNLANNSFHAIFIKYCMEVQSPCSHLGQSVSAKKKWSAGRTLQQNESLPIKDSSALFVQLRWYQSWRSSNSNASFQSSVMLASMVEVLRWMPKNVEDFIFIFYFYFHLLNHER